MTPEQLALLKKHKIALVTAQKFNDFDWKAIQLGMQLDRFNTPANQVAWAAEEAAAFEKSPEGMQKKIDDLTALVTELQKKTDTGDKGTGDGQQQQEQKPKPFDQMTQTEQFAAFVEFQKQQSGGGDAGKDGAQGDSGTTAGAPLTAEQISKAIADGVDQKFNAMFDPKGDMANNPMSGMFASMAQSNQLLTNHFVGDIDEMEKDDKFNEYLDRPIYNGSSLTMRSYWDSHKNSRNIAEMQKMADGFREEFGRQPPMMGAQHSLSDELPEGHYSDNDVLTARNAYLQAQGTDKEEELFVAYNDIAEKAEQQQLEREMQFQQAGVS